MFPTSAAAWGFVVFAFLGGIAAVFAFQAAFRSGKREPLVDGMLRRFQALELTGPVADELAQRLINLDLTGAAMSMSEKRREFAAQLHSIAARIEQGLK